MRARASSGRPIIGNLTASKREFQRQTNAAASSGRRFYRLGWIAIAVACIVWNVTAARSPAQCAPPAGCGCNVSAVDPGHYSYEQPSYAMPGDFAQWCAPCCCGPRWSFAAEAIALQRTATRNQSLFLQAFQTPDLFNAREFNFPVAFGAENQRHPTRHIRFPVRRRGRLLSA